MGPPAKKSKTEHTPKTTLAAFFSRKPSSASGAASSAASVTVPGRAETPAERTTERVDPVDSSVSPTQASATSPASVSVPPAVPEKSLADASKDVAIAATVSSKAPAAAVVSGSGSSSSSKAPATLGKTSSQSHQKAAHDLIDLAKNGDWEKVFAALEANPHVINIRPKVREYGILHQAAFHGSEMAVNRLLKHWSADAQLLTKGGQTAAEVAKEQGHDKVASILLASVQSELTPEKVAKAACASAAPDWSLAHKLIDLARDARWDDLFLELEARPDMTNARPSVREYSILHQAVFHGEQKVVDSLIDKFGADPQTESKFGEKVLSVARGQGHDALLKSLKKRLCEEVDDNQAEEEEEEEDDFDMVQMPNGSWKIQKKGAGPKSDELCSPVQGVTPLPTLTAEVVNAAHELLDLAKDGCWAKVFTRLDKERGLVNVRPAVREFSLLHQAAWQGDVEAATTLVKKYGADTGLVSKQGKAVAAVAEEEGHSFPFGFLAES